MRNLMKLLVIRLVVNLADSIFYIAALWHINDRYASSFLLGIFIAINYLPDLLLIFFGPLIDRANPKKILFGSILVQMVAVGLLLVFIQQISFWLLMVLVFLSVMASSISYVLEDVLIPQVVDYNQVVFANSLFSISYKVLDSIFNAISSILQAVLGFTLLLGLDLGVFSLALFLVLIFKFKFKKQTDTEKFDLPDYKKELSQGTQFLMGNKLLLKTSSLLLVINIFTAFQTVAVPLVSVQYFNGSIFYGLFLTLSGLGGICGNMLAPILIKYMKANQIIGLFLALNALCWMGAMFFRNYLVSLTLLFVCHLSKGIFNILFNALYQQIPPKELLGRVNTAVDSFITLGMPLGSILAGILLDWNLSLVLLLIALPDLLAALLFYHDRELKDFRMN